MAIALSASISLNINGLLDDLLVEIFVRLPCKSAIRCMCVSKRWCNLISDPNFHRRFIHRHYALLQQLQENDHEKQWSLTFLSKHKLLVLFQNHISNLELSAPEKQLSLSFLGPAFDPQWENQIGRSYWLGSIIGCSNGLFLCTNSREATYADYYVCNPLTKVWIQLPACPTMFTSSVYGVVDLLAGFVCEPHYHVEAEAENVTLNFHCRFRVMIMVCYPQRKFEFEVEVFSSETGQWCTLLVSCPKGFKPATGFRKNPDFLDKVTDYRGSLYFMGEESILVYDPFNYQCCTLDYPTDSNDIFASGHIGHSCGNLRISQVSYSDAVLTVSIWELKEQESSWQLLRRKHLPSPLLDSYLPHLQVRGFHPYNADIVFFQFAHCFLVGNLRTDKFEEVLNSPSYAQTQMLLLALPGWPTPVSYLQ